MRTESDQIGQRDVEDDALYGIHTLRARENFKVSARNVNPSLIRAVIEVKKAAAEANIKAGLLDQKIGKAIMEACDTLFSEDTQSKRWKETDLDALQGGAGTSVNMNINEVLANMAKEFGKKQS